MKRAEYEMYIRGKRVVVVGPAPSIVGSCQHDLIESYDVVVRLNHALPVPDSMQQDIGSRTDVLYSTVKKKSILQDFEMLNQLVRWIVCPYANVKPFDKYMHEFDDATLNFNLPFVCAYDKEQYKSIESSMGTRPMISLSAIQHLLFCEASEIHITGLTFGMATSGNKGGYYEDYKNKNDYKGEATEKEVVAIIDRCGVHDIQKHVEYLRQLMTSHPHITCDKAMKEVIDG